jgi:hypothetical protein
MAHHMREQTNEYDQTNNKQTQFVLTIPLELAARDRGGKNRVARAARNSRAHISSKQH